MQELLIVIYFNNVTMKQSNNCIVPQHIAVIMDGNRRWAREHGLPELEGHRRAAGPVLEKLIEHAAKRGIKYLTLWAFSTENWKRKQEEVKGLMNIFRWGLKTYGMKMHKKGIRIRVIGDLSKIEKDLREGIETFVELTKNNKTITVVFALNYGGRDEIIRAINKMVYSLQFTVDSNITIQQYNNFLDTKDIPDPELIVRTGGEMRTSGFLLWQSEYSEWMFPSWYMPDFTPERLDEVIEEFNKRKRRFGK